MSLNFDPPAGFNVRPDGRGGWVLSRPPVRVIYPCGKCGRSRGEKINNAKTRVYVLPCHVCEMKELFRWIKCIDEGLCPEKTPKLASEYDKDKGEPDQ